MWVSAIYVSMHCTNNLICQKFKTFQRLGCTVFIPWTFLAAGVELVTLIKIALARLLVNQTRYRVFSSTGQAYMFLIISEVQS